MLPSRHPSCRTSALAGIAGAIAISLVSPPLTAAEVVVGTELVAATEEPAVVGYPATVGSDRGEWLRVLTAGGEIAHDGNLRRRLTREELDALNQELRAVMRSAYKSTTVPTD